MPPTAPTRIGPPPIHLDEQPALHQAVPAGIADLALLHASTAHLAGAVAKDLHGTAVSLGGSDWRGRAATSFASATDHLCADLHGAVTALQHASTILDRLSRALAEAQGQAAQATTEADDINAESAHLNTAWCQEYAAGAAAPSLALRLRADDLESRAHAVRRQTYAAAHDAHQAFTQAAHAMDGVTATAPAVRAALQRAQTHSEPLGGHIIDAAFNIVIGAGEAVVDGVLGAADGAQLGLDPLTDAATVADADAMVSAFATAGRDLTGAVNATADEDTVLKGIDSWGDPTTLEDHFARHASDFGAASPEEYAAQANAFLRRSQMEGLPTNIDRWGTIRTYGPTTNEFGAYNPNGTTRTYFAPNPAKHGLPTNWDYWLIQKGTAPWTP